MTDEEWDQVGKPGFIWDVTGDAGSSYFGQDEDTILEEAERLEREKDFYISSGIPGDPFHSDEEYLAGTQNRTLKEP